MNFDRGQLVNHLFKHFFFGPRVVCISSVLCLWFIWEFQSSILRAEHWQNHDNFHLNSSFWLETPLCVFSLHILFLLQLQFVIKQKPNFCTQLIYYWTENRTIFGIYFTIFIYKVSLSSYINKYIRNIVVKVISIIVILNSHSPLAY